MTGDPTAEPKVEGTGWRRAAALFALLVFTSVLPAGMLVAIPLLVLIGMGGIRRGPVFVASVLAMIVALAGQRDPLWFAERGWALMVGGLFAGVTLWLPRWRLTSRALAAVGGALAVAVALCTLRVGAWASLDWSIKDRLAEGLATGLWALEMAREGAPVSPAFLNAIYRTVELQGQLFPAVVALESMMALAVGWWLYVRLVHRDDHGLASVGRFGFNDHMVWLLIGGLVLLVVAPWDGATRVGLNLAVFMGALYAFRGTGVLVHVSGGASLPATLFFILGVLLAAPIVVGATLLLGIADTWLDLRARAENPA